MMSAFGQSAEIDGRRSPSLAVVVPAHQAAHQIGACLDGLIAAGFACSEIVVVDDGSTDGTGTIARAAGPTVLRNELPAGPAEARNRGVRQVPADVIVFCDADVVVHPGTRERLLSHFRLEGGIAAVFGSYDDAPPASRIVSRYRNLLHHFVHQHGRPDASTFWTGLGAVRRADFLRLGGFDAAWQNIEDIEFGLRLKRAGGRIRLDRTLLCTHLKEWTLGSMLRADWKGRAVPWTRLVLFHNAPHDDLNLTLPHRISAASVAAFPFCIGLIAFEGWALIGYIQVALIEGLRRFLGNGRSR
jgi:glycosyltransferase involved in cell wall biosynthesis